MIQIKASSNCQKFASITNQTTSISFAFHKQRTAIIGLKLKAYRDYTCRCVITRRHLEQTDVMNRGVLCGDICLETRVIRAGAVCAAGKTKKVEVWHFERDMTHQQIPV